MNKLNLLNQKIWCPDPMGLGLHVWSSLFVADGLLNEVSLVEFAVL